MTFYGSVPAEKVPSFTTLADALLISLSDSPDLGLTVPGKLASYMAAGKPVVASMNGAGYEAVRESGGGLVSPACDQAALAANLLALYRMAPAALNCCAAWKALPCGENKKTRGTPFWIKKFWC